MWTMDVMTFETKNNKKKTHEKLSIWYSILLSLWKHFNINFCFFFFFFVNEYFFGLILLCVYHNFFFDDGHIEKWTGAEKNLVIDEKYGSLFRAKAYQIGPLHSLLFFSNAHNFFGFSMEMAYSVVYSLEAFFLVEDSLCRLSYHIFPFFFFKKKGRFHH